MNKDLQRRVEKERAEKAAHARKIEEMRKEGAADASGDLARNVEAEKKKKKAQKNIRDALKDK
mgnify:CR=1 FL=1|tara:strand:- start:82 stop:270 length:189 start_codon:yes stop_codon:yes gene_type:complete